MKKKKQPMQNFSGFHLGNRIKIILTSNMPDTAYASLWVNSMRLRWIMMEYRGIALVTNYQSAALSYYGVRSVNLRVMLPKTRNTVFRVDGSMTSSAFMVRVRDIMRLTRQKLYVAPYGKLMKFEYKVQKNESFDKVLRRLKNASKMINVICPKRKKKKVTRGPVSTQRMELVT